MKKLEPFSGAVIHEINLRISGGELNAARDLLQPFLARPTRVPVELRVRFLYQAWSLTHYREVIAILAPTFQRGAEVEPFVPRTQQSQLLFALSLFGFKATKVALQYLQGITDPRLGAEASLFLGALYGNRWELERAQLAVHRALERSAHPLSPTQESMARIIGGANTLLQGHSPRKARADFDYVLERTSPSHESARGLNALFWRILSFIYEDNLGEARASLEQMRVWQKSASFSIFEKDFRLCNLLVNLKELKSSQKKERERVRKQFETLRDQYYADGELTERPRLCEYLWAHFARDSATFERLWYGSPIPGLRRVIEDRITVKSTEIFWENPHSDFRGMASRKKSKVAVLDLVNFEEPGTLFHRVLLSLTSDFYQRLTYVEIFEDVFQGGYFESASSETKIKQALFRLRKWIAARKLPLKIQVKGRLVALRATGPLRIRIPNPSRFATPKGSPPSVLRFQALLKTLATRAGDREFTSGQVMAWLNLGTRTSRSYIAQWVKQGELVRIPLAA